MSDYMLDTDTCAFILRKSSPVLMARIQTVPLQQQCMSVVTLAELLYGVQVSSRKKSQSRCRGPACPPCQGHRMDGRRGRALRGDSG